MSIRNCNAYIQQWMSNNTCLACRLGPLFSDLVGYKRLELRYLCCREAICRQRLYCCDYWREIRAHRHCATLIYFFTELAC
jgi:hypothetical protein